MLTPELLEALRSPAGRELLARAEALAEDPFAVQKLGPHVPRELAAAAVDQARLRRRARSKFSRAAEMWFAPSLLEQASGEIASRHRAGRFRHWDRVGDLCCGLGADTVFLAAHAQVAAVDRDPLALALARANAEVFGCSERVQQARGELPAAAPRVPAAWVDPGRREGARRTRRLDSISPTLEEALSLRERIGSLGIKLSPASHDAELEAVLAGVPHEREFLSVQGECRELALWTGELASALPRRATVLPSGAELAGKPAALGPARPPQGWLLEPDPAVIRAGLVGNLAELLGAWPIDPKLAYLAVSSPPDTPLAAVYRIEEPQPFSGKALAERLRRLEASDVVIKTRGAAAQPEILRHQMRGVLKQGRPDCRPVVFVTRLGPRPIMILGERFGPGADE
jgi:hypothetical protein